MNISHSNILIKNGIIAMLLAMVGGFLLIFSMIGGISLSPLPIFIHYEIPGSAAGWRMLHVGTMMNGLMGILLGSAMRWYMVSNRGSAIICWGTIITIWGNVLFYMFDIFAPNHGLTLQANRLGEASLAGALSFIPGLVAIFTLLAALVVLLRAKPSASLPVPQG